MTKSRTANYILIIGAGASKDLHQSFCLAGELLETIESRVTGNKELDNYLLNDADISYGTLQTFKNNLHNYRLESPYKSIDEFLTEVATFPEYEDWREDYLHIGRMAILFELTGWEGEFKNTFEFENVKHTWVFEIIKCLEENDILNHYTDTGKTPEKRSLKILTFNYDRTLEHCLTEYYRGSKYEYAISVFIKNHIKHVYSELGFNTPDAFPFGERKFGIMRDSLDKIRVSYNTRNINEDLAGAFSVHDANYVGSIGFSFDYFNCRHIGFSNWRGVVKANVVTPEPAGTFKNRRQMTTTIRNMYRDVEFKYGSCKDFLKYFFSLNPFR